MSKLEIKFAQLGRGINQVLKKYPKKSCTPLYIWAGGKLSIFFDRKLLESPWVRDKGLKLDCTDTEYLWSFFYTLLSEAKHFDEREHVVDFIDDPLQFHFKRTGDEVQLKFGSGKDITGSTIIPYIDFLEEVLQVTEKFIKTLLEINPKLAEHEDVVMLIKEREEVNTLYLRQSKFWGDDKK